MLDRDLKFQPWDKYGGFIYGIDEYTYPNQTIMGFLNKNLPDQGNINYIQVLACVSGDTVSELRLKVGFKDERAINEFLAACPCRLKNLIYSTVEKEDLLARKHTIVFNPNNRKRLDEFLQILARFDLIDYQCIDHIYGFSRNFKEAMNGTQRNIIDGVIKFPLDDIDETLENEPDIALKALNATLKENISLEDVNIFKAKNVWESILQIREIFSHPCPQNRTENYPYFGIPNDPNTIVYKDNNGKAAFEQKGLLSLTARNNDTDPHVTKAAVAGYIYQNIHEKIRKFKKEHQTILNGQTENFVNTILKVGSSNFFDKSRIMIANINVGYGNALFISGEHPKLGAWQQAIRMSCHQSEIAWIIRLDKSLIDTPFKFLIGPYSAGVNPSVSDLIWENGENRKIALSFNLWPYESDLWPSIFKNELRNLSHK